MEIHYQGFFTHSNWSAQEAKTPPYFQALVQDSG